jgi:hypothetical protein
VFDKFYNRLMRVLYNVRLLSPQVDEKATGPDESIARIFLDGKWAFQVERYPDFYSAYWPTDIVPSKFMGLAKNMGAAYDSPVIMYLKSTRRNDSYKFADVLERLNSLDDDCLLLRISVGGFDLGWHFDNLTGRYLSGMSAQHRDLDFLGRLYEMTNRLPFPYREVAKVLAGYEERKN